MVKTIVVAGGASFLGSHLVDALVRSGQEVVVIDDLTNGRLAFLSDAIASGRVTFAYTQADANAATLDAVLSREVGPFVDEIYDCTVEGRPALVELARRHDARLVRIVAAADDDDAGAFVAASTARDGGRLVDACAVRIHGAYGPRMEIGEAEPVGAILGSAVAGGPIRVPAQASLVPLYVADAIALIERAAKSPLKHTVVDAAGAESIGLIDLARVLVAARRLTCDVHELEDQQSVAARGVDLERAHALGWSPSTPLAAGLAATYAWVAAESRLYA